MKENGNQGFHSLEKAKPREIASLGGQSRARQRHSAQMDIGGRPGRWKEGRQRPNKQARRLVKKNRGEGKRTDGLMVLRR